MILNVGVFYLHPAYYFTNRGQTIIIEHDEIILITKEGDINKSNFSEIDKLIYCKSVFMDKGHWVNVSSVKLPLYENYNKIRKTNNYYMPNVPETG